MAESLENGITQFKEKLLTMAAHAEAAVNCAVRALIRRDDDLARQTREGDDLIDQFEIVIDDLALQLLTRRPGPSDLRLITVAMKISQNLERVGDEATTISRRCLELSLEPQLRQAAEVPALTVMALAMLKDALDAFVNRDAAKAHGVIPRDAEVDALNRRLQAELAAFMAERPSAITRCLNLMVICKSIERIADRASDVAELVVYMLEGRDIRHAALKSPPTETNPTQSDL